MRPKEFTSIQNDDEVITLYLTKQEARALREITEWSSAVKNCVINVNRDAGFPLVSNASDLIIDMLEHLRSHLSARNITNLSSYKKKDSKPSKLSPDLEDLLRQGEPCGGTLLYCKNPDAHLRYAALTPEQHRLVCEEYCRRTEIKHKKG